MAHNLPFLGTIAVGAFHGYQTAQGNPVDYGAGAATLVGLTLWITAKLADIPPPASISPVSTLFIASSVSAMLGTTLGHYAGRYVGYRKDDGA